MSFLRIQNLKKDADGKIIRGCASIMRTVYDKDNKYKSHQIVIEKLGKILWISEDSKVGIFFNTKRGLFEYNSVNEKFSDVPESDKRIANKIQPKNPDIHVNFALSDFFLFSLKKFGFIEIFSKIFTEKSFFERFLCHIFHSIFKNGSHIHTDDFIRKSLFSYYINDLNTDTLFPDTFFFSKMSDENIKIDFFKNFISYNKEKNKEFGKACIIDSTPLPNDICDNPFNALSCHGAGSSSVQIRLVLATDKDTGLPLWFSLIPGNVLDVNTLTQIKNEMTEYLELNTEEYTLDAGYCSRNLIDKFFTEKVNNSNNENIIVKMPARKGYPYKELYYKKKDQFSKGKYMFLYENHTYYGDVEEIDLFDRKVNAYIYVDKENALSGLKEYMSENEEEFKDLKVKDKDFKTIQNGYFILLSTYKTEPKDLLMKYFARISIENFFKTSKSYLSLLPLSKWSDLTVRGKIMFDMINTILYLQIRENVNKNKLSTSKVVGILESLICFVDRNNKIQIDYPMKKMNELREKFSLTTDNNIELNEYFKKFGLPV